MIRRDSQTKAVRRSSAPRTATSKSAGTQVDASTVMGALKRWFLIALPIGLLLAAGGGYAVYYNYEPNFKATAALMVKRSTPYIAFQNKEKNDQGLGGEAEIIRSPLVIGPLLAKPEFRKLPEIQELIDPVSNLPQLISVGTRKGSELMKVSFAGPDPRNAATIVNEVIDQYLSIRREFTERSSKVIIEKLEEQKELRKIAVQEKNDEVRQISLRLTGRDPFAQESGKLDGSVGPIGDLQGRITTNSYSQRVLQKEIELLEKELESSPPAPTETEINNRLLVDSVIDLKQREIWNAEEAYEQFKLTTNFGSNHPTIRKFLARIKAKKDSKQKLIEEIRPRIEKELKGELLARKEAELKSLRNQLDSLLVGEQFLNEELSKQKKNRQLTSAEIFELADARKSLRKYEEILDQISARIFILRTEQWAPSRIEPLYPATAPFAPISELPLKQIALVSLVGFCFPFGLAVLWEIKIRRFSNSEQISEHFDTPIVAEVANLPRGAFGNRRLSRRLSRELRVYEESVDSLRTNLLLALREQKFQVIAVASSVSGEGKTSIATQLAISVANAIGKPTLLVDGDMRAPDIHHLFDLDSHPGFAEVLAGEIALKDAVVESSIENLSVLPAGQLTRNPAYLLSNGSAAKFFQDVRNDYEYVILDTPPILSANESMLLTDAADGTLFCVMRETSRHAQVKAACKRINAAGGQMVGVVFNNVPAKDYTRTYGNYDYQLDE